MNQKQLFPDEPLPARKTDPETSKIAARGLIQTRKLSEQRTAVLAALSEQDGQTSAEVGKRLGGGYNARYVAARRLPELERLGIVRRGAVRVCEANGTKQMTWWVR